MEKSFKIFEEIYYFLWKFTEKGCIIKVNRKEVLYAVQRGHLMVGYLLGNYMVEEGFMTTEQLETIISAQERVRVKLGLIAVLEGMLTLDQAVAINRMQQGMDKCFGDIAIEKGYLTGAQVASLLKMQGNGYLMFAQTLVDEGIVTMHKLQNILKDYQIENGFTNTEMEAVKSGDEEKIIPLFLPQGADEYQEIVTIALKMLVRCVDRHAYPMYGRLADSREVRELKMPVIQELAGAEYWRAGIADEKGGLCAVASALAGEEYHEINEEVRDAAGEFVNCVDGLFAAAKGMRNVELELMPPEFSENGVAEGSSILIMPFGIRGAAVNFIVTKQKDGR